jgi:hypothetical protein
MISNFESLSEEDSTKYAGEWIAIINNKIVAHGRDVKEVVKKAKMLYPKERPLIGRLPDAIPSIYALD